jgi:hypothetical protein
VWAWYGGWLGTGPFPGGQEDREGLQLPPRLGMSVRKGLVVSLGGVYQRFGSGPEGKTQIGNNSVKCGKGLVAMRTSVKGEGWVLGLAGPVEGLPGVR